VIALRIPSMGATASFPEKKTTAPALRNHNGMSKAHSERTLDGDKSSFLSPFRISTTEGIIRVAGIFFSCDLESLRCCEMKSRIQRICVDLVHNGLLVLLNANNDGTSDIIRVIFVLLSRFFISS
jgi:hypothetical protein